MNWEKVKGFCRRQTQKINENYRHADCTRDDEAEQGVRRVTTYRKVAANCAARLEKIVSNTAETITMFECIKEDLKLMEVDDLTMTATRIEMTCLALHKQHESLVATVHSETDKLRKFFDECAGVEGVAADRKMKKLEFDFFRNKVSTLKKNPPNDPARIPRNEARIEEWQKLYDDANDRLKNLTHKLTLQGIRSVADATSTSLTGFAKYFGDSTQSWRATFGNGGSQVPVLAASQTLAARMPTVQQTQQAVAQHQATAPPAPAAPGGTVGSPSGVTQPPATAISTASPPSTSRFSQQQPGRPKTVDDPFAM